MPIAANITAPQSTQSGIFTVTITFAEPVEDFEKTNVRTIDTRTGGTGVLDYEIQGSDTTYNLPFTLPEDVTGSIQIEMTGQVTVVSSGQSETVTATARTVAYDNVTNVTVTFGTAAYRAHGGIAIPVTFAKAVLAPAKTIFQLTRVSGDSLEGVEYRLVGEGATYTLILEVPPDRSGTLQIACDGYALQADMLLWDNITCGTKTVNYDTRVPFIKNYDIPENYVVGETFDLRIAFNVPVTGWHANNTLTEILIEEGARLGTPLPHKWVGSTPPDFNTDVPSDLIGTDWQVLAAPPGGHAGPWHGEQGQYFLMRIPVTNASATGIVNYTLRENAVRGPSGAPQPVFPRNYLTDGEGNYLGDGKGNYLGTGN